ncbi:MAG: glycosyltransferase family 39 protein, partial [Acidobacteriota bacterium]|nr:glycosyltransferase family 39 protein [Acidobacteriota bacterium]
MRRVHKRWIWGIVLLAAVLRFVHIDAQPVGHHGWRQADTAAVARNFHEQGYRLFRPQIDWAIPGYVEMEFPLYPWVVSLAYGALGEHIALARMLSAVASVVSVLFVFLLVKRILGDDEALWAAGLWAILPLSIYFGRATMPESWMLAFSIAGVYQFSRWVERSSLTLLLTSAVCIALACLLKPTSLYLGLPLLWLAWRQYGPALFARWQLWLFAAVITIPVAAWYWHAHWLGATYGATFGVFTGSSGKLGHWELLLQPGFYNRLFLDFFADRVLTWFGFLLFLVGLLLSRHHTRERLFDVWLLGAIIMLLVGSGASSVHE